MNLSRSETHKALTIQTTMKIQQLLMCRGVCRRHFCPLPTECVQRRQQSQRTTSEFEETQQFRLDHDRVFGSTFSHDILPQKNVEQNNTSPNKWKARAHTMSTQAAIVDQLQMYYIM